MKSPTKIGSEGSAATRIVDVAKRIAGLWKPVTRPLDEPWQMLDWPVAPLASLNNIKHVEIALRGEPARTPATVIGAPEALAAEMVAFERTPITPPQCFIAEIERAHLLDGVIATAEATILAESLINRMPGDLPLWPSQQRRPSRLRNGRHVLLKQCHDSNYGHWLVECLPRLALVRDRYDLRDLRFIVSGWHGPAMARVYADSLALFGIGAEQIVEVGIEPVIVDRLIYPTPMTAHPWQIAPRCLEVIEEMAKRVPPAPDGAARLYLSRNQAGRRRLVNEQEILPIVRAHGFRVVETETMSLRGQIGLFRAATHIVGSYGAALTNIAFTDGRPSLLALTSPWMQDDFFSTLMSLKRGRYASLHGDVVGKSEDRDADFRIDPAAFEAMLAAFLANEGWDAALPDTASPRRDPAGTKTLPSRRSRV